MSSKDRDLLSGACLFLFLPSTETYTLDVLDAHRAALNLFFVGFLLLLLFFLLRFLKRIYLFVVGINAGVGMPWRGCESQKRAWCSLCFRKTLLFFYYPHQASCLHFLSPQESADISGALAMCLAFIDGTADSLRISCKHFYH